APHGGLERARGLAEPFTHVFRRAKHRALERGQRGLGSLDSGEARALLRARQTREARPELRNFRAQRGHFRGGLPFERAELTKHPLEHPHSSKARRRDAFASATFAASCSPTPAMLVASFSSCALTPAILSESSRVAALVLPSSSEAADFRAPVAVPEAAWY